MKENVECGEVYTEEEVQVMKFYGSHLDAISCLTEERRLDLALTTWPVKYIVVNSKHLTDEKFKKLNCFKCIC